MKLETLVGKELCSAIVEIRDNSDNYEEIVLSSKDISGWNKILTDKLGPPLISKEEYEIVGSSADVQSSKINVALEFADAYGGISQGQTLYHGIYDSTVILIMIWPWQDNKRVTLKKAIL
jgi:hypothetical protein